MPPTWIIIVSLAIICVLIIFACASRAREQEDFATIQDKATQLSGWMRAHPNARYTEFIRENPDSNIVEYTKMRALYTTHRLGSKFAVEALRV